MRIKKKNIATYKKRNVESGAGKSFFITVCEKNIHILSTLKREQQHMQKRQIHIRTCRFLCLKYGRSVLSFPQIWSLLVNIVVQPIHKQQVGMRAPCF